MITLLINKGHGGTDSGAVGRDHNIYESTYTDIVAEKLKVYIDQNSNGDVKTITYRNMNGLKDLSAVPRYSNSIGADYLISIHFNSSDNRTAHGIETYFYKTGEDLAKSIQTNLIKDTRLTDRGVKYGNFYVIRESKAIGVLVECGFISNANEEDLIMTSEYEDALTKAIGDAFLDYTGTRKVETNMPEVQEHWAKESYYTLIKAGIQIDEMRFDDKITRGEVFALLAKTLGLIKQ